MSGTSEPEAIVIPVARESGAGLDVNAKWTPRAVTTSIAAIVSMMGTYAVLRAFEALFKSEPNPATVIGSERIAMFWRLEVGCLVAGATATLVFVLSGRWLVAATRLVAFAVPTVAVVAVL